MHTRVCKPSTTANQRASDCCRDDMRSLKPSLYSRTFDDSVNLSLLGMTKMDHFRNRLGSIVSVNFEKSQQQAIATMYD